jgi:hypothetical protein
MWRKRAFLVAVNLAVFAVLAELLALWIYYERTGRLFYTHARAYATIEETERGELTGDALHPYFGPIHKPGVRPETNNIGFGSPYPFPYTRKDPREFLVGIFGGSVARQFCDRGAARLAERLGLGDRRVVPLCFAHEGYKQPQQLIVLAYFLSLGQQFDLVLNIDGFNEVALGTYNHDRGRDVSMPSPIHLDPLINLIDRATLTPPMVESLAAISRYKTRLNALVPRLRSARTAFGHFALDRYYEFTRQGYTAELARFAALPPNSPDASLVQVTPAVKARDASTLYDDIAAQWAAASLLMHDMLAARAVRYAHVLQPNQYYTSRAFSPEEARVARSDDTPFKPPVEKGYPLLQRAAAELRQTVQFIDATGAFDAEPMPVYQDDCCHYTQLGYERLAELIARRLTGGPLVR